MVIHKSQGGGGQGFSDNSAKLLVIKFVTMEGGVGVKKCPQLRDVMNERPLIHPIVMINYLPLF